MAVFSEMRIRDITREDYSEIKRWLDKAHGGKVSPELFFEDGREAKVVEDSKGAVFFALFSQAKRADIQFNPFELNPLRTGKALKILNDHVDGEIVFRSKANPLMAFMERLGYKPEPDTFVRKN